MEPGLSLEIASCWLCNCLSLHLCVFHRNERTVGTSRSIVKVRYVGEGLRQSCKLNQRRFVNKTVLKQSCAKISIPPRCLSLTNFMALDFQVLNDLVQGEFMQLGAKETENERFSHYFTKTYRKTASLIANSLKAVSW